MATKIAPKIPVTKAKKSSPTISSRASAALAIFRKAGIDANLMEEEHARALVGFSSRIDDTLPFLMDFTDYKRSSIEIYVENSDIKSFDINKKLRQIVLNISEAKHSFKRAYDVFKGKETKKKFEEYAIRSFPVTLPKNTTFKLLKTEADFINRKTHKRVTVEATIPAQTSSFLIGYDEKHLFICMLPKQAKTVLDAHTMLKPLPKRKEFARQGEFFFYPLNDSEIRDFKKSSGNFADSYEELSLNDCFQLETENPHYSTTRVKGGANKCHYVSGMIWDDCARHEPLFLNGWYRVMPNKEIENVNGAWD